MYAEEKDSNDIVTQLDITELGTALDWDHFA